MINYPFHRKITESSRNGAICRTPHGTKSVLIIFTSAYRLATNSLFSYIIAFQGYSILTRSYYTELINTAFSWYSKRPNHTCSTSDDGQRHVWGNISWPVPWNNHGMELTDHRHISGPLGSQRPSVPRFVGKKKKEIRPTDIKTQTPDGCLSPYELKNTS